MALTPGTRLGPYEISAYIAAGGMGEVYRARDGRLGRDVALKILPDSVAADSNRLARLRREAQVLALLIIPTSQPSTDSKRSSCRRVQSWRWCSN